MRSFLFWLINSKVRTEERKREESKMAATESVYNLIPKDAAGSGYGQDKPAL